MKVYISTGIYPTNCQLCKDIDTKVAEFAYIFYDFIVLTDGDPEALHKTFLSNVITGRMRDTVGFFSLLSSSVASLKVCRLIDTSSMIRAWSESKNSPLLFVVTDGSRSAACMAGSCYLYHFIIS